MSKNGYIMLPHFPQTPAPWYDDGYRIYAPTTSEDKRDGRVIVEYKHIEGFQFGDSCLMTAAPKLLEALIRMTQHRMMQLEMSGATRKAEDVEAALEAIAEANGWRIQ